MKKNKSFIIMLVFWVCAMIIAVGTSHLLRFVDGPLRYSGLVIIVMGIFLFYATHNCKIVFSDNSVIISTLIGKKTIIPYEDIKSVEYIETKTSGGNGIRTKVRNIRFNHNNGTSIQFAETQIKYKKCVSQLLDACDNGRFPKRAIKSTTRERLLRSINYSGVHE